MSRNDYTNRMVGKNVPEKHLEAIPRGEILPPQVFWKRGDGDIILPSDYPGLQGEVHNKSSIFLRLREE